MKKVKTHMAKKRIFLFKWQLIRLDPNQIKLAYEFCVKTVGKAFLVTIGRLGWEQSGVELGEEPQPERAVEKVGFGTVPFNFASSVDECCEKGIYNRYICLF